MVNRHAHTVAGSAFGGTAAFLPAMDLLDAAALRGLPLFA